VETKVYKFYYFIVLNDTLIYHLNVIKSGNGMAEEDLAPVKLKRDVKKDVEDFKIHQRQSISEVVGELVKFYEKYGNKHPSKIIKPPKTKGKAEG